MTEKKDGQEPTVSVLDYGAGLGSGLWAANDVFKSQKMAAVEPNMAMRKLGKFLSENTDDNLYNALWVDSLAMIPQGEKGKFDIVILGYVLQEIPSAKGRQLVIDALWQRLKDNGVFIVVEPGSPKGYRFVHSFREWILKTKTRDEANIIAPCPHQHACPMAANANAWCNFSQITIRYPNEIFPKKPQERDMVNEKFSFLCV